MYRFFLRPLFFLFPPERAHYFTMALFRLALAIPGAGYLWKTLYAVRRPALERQVMGLTFSNPVGLAAGFDKDGKYFRLMAALGFGHIELGTVTPRPQAGNPRPRLFRLKPDRALINRMGFNNDGVETLVQRLQGPRPKGLIIGGNIGKNKDTPNEDAAADYLFCFDRLFPYVDYFVVNVSSPNTPGLRELQDKKPLTALLQQLQSRNKETPHPKPILLKIAPDLTDEQLQDIVDIVKTTSIAGVIATNTTIARTGLQTPEATLQAIGAGGLSGAPLRNRSTEVIRYLRQQSQGSFVIIGVGGIDSPEAAREKLDAGADLVQVYTGLVYYGPGLVRDILKALVGRERG
ncbi:MAG: quinone-dependent dihydroorotate dehydrogenase [Saprospiraceae bacterium]|nr:quinone-dependent dihydroorotate dehydrogenase [Saprospiraceae bacterium]